MSVDADFSPDWVSPPGDSIADIAKARGLSVQALSSSLGVSVAETTDLLHGISELTVELAQVLERTLGVSAAFWLRREAQYRNSFSSIAAPPIETGYRRWLGELPVADMAKFGWVARRKGLAEQVSECLDFFDSMTISEWQARSDDFLGSAAFRTSPRLVSNPGALHAWLRRGELVASEIDCASWNAESLRRALPEIRKMTRVREPTEFLPELTKTCAACGVAVVVARTPNGCRASGAVRALSSSDKAMVLLSFRFLSDDQFWFTFFHEVGHLLLHFERGFFIEGGETVDLREELEANKFSAELLIPPEHQEELHSLGTSAFSVARFSKRLGISPGIVVGQLQHQRLLSHRQLNHLKIRYSWTS